MKKSSVTRTRRFTYFQILCYALERWIRTQHQILSGKTSWCGSRVHHNTELWTQLMVSQWNSSGIFSQDSPHCSSTTKFKSLLLRLSVTPENFTGRIIFMSMFNDISWRSQDNEQECELNANFVSIYARRFSPDRWSFLGPGSEKKWYSTHDSKPQGERDRVAELMMIKFGESGHPVFRVTSPLSRGTLKSRGGGKLSTHFCADGGTIETVFRTIISVNQLSIYGAVSDLCEDCKSCHVRTGRLVMSGQSDNKFVDENTHTFDRWSCARRSVAKVPRTSGERLSQRNRVIKICTDAGFPTTVDVGQWFMTEDTDEFSQFTESVACREYTLARDEKYLTRKVGFEGTPKLGPCWKSQPAFYKVNMEWKLELNL